ncbi:MAG: DUF1080 domain-containing protein [Verrucomicrobiales bacterium]|nr:DUF1080 domain-containing protein [Verrucomicrobiales bacterium]
MLRHCILLSAFGLLTPIAVANPVDLLEGPLEESFVQHLNGKSSLESGFPEVWRKNEEGHLYITGKGLGYLRTKESFKDYHLVVEYRWREHTFAGRSDRARDGGILFHLKGEDGAFGGTWPACLQAQLIEGGSGDLVCLPTEAIPAKFTAHASLQDPPIWLADGKSNLFPRPGMRSGHLGWKDRSENWKDVKGFRGELDIENPVGEWNRIEVLALNDTVEIRLNGEVVNRASNVFPADGNIGFQTELASYEVRRAEVYKPGEFTDAWTGTSRSTDMGYLITSESTLPRALPLSPGESLAAWELDGEFEIQLVAAEPLTCDPVDIVWDDQGRLFVAEMGDYPLPADDAPFLSRIRHLIDHDGDGRMDEAITWADELDHVQGLLPMKGGLLATTRSAILFLKDTNGDLRADHREVLFRSNAPRHNQLQISSPRYGLDNHIYLNNGLDGKEIYPEGSPDSTVAFPRLNLRYHPRSGRIEAATGTGQYGGTLDAFGRHFFCSNRNPAMFAVMPLAAVKRNPLAGIKSGHEDIEMPGAAIRPLLLSHTTSSAHAGTYTAACGLAVYTGDLMRELAGDLFICDPTAQLVTRNKLVPNGASFRARRIGDHREFLASSDEWSRPVQIRNGPDGAIYIVDMYRRFIDHARFFPEEFAASNYMRAGVDHGRIWRIVPVSTPARPIAPLVTEPVELVETLTHENGWHRTTAQRLLVENEMKTAVPLLRKAIASSHSEVGVSHALRTLQGLDALTPEILRSVPGTGPGLIENKLFAISELELGREFERWILKQSASEQARIRFLALALFPEIIRDENQLTQQVITSPGDEWYQRAILSSSPKLVPGLLGKLLKSDEFMKTDPEVASATLRAMADFTAASATLSEMNAVLENLSKDIQWPHFAVTSGFSSGIGRNPAKPGNLEAIMSSPPVNFTGGAATLSRIVENASTIALSFKRSDADRILALSLVSQSPWDEKIRVADALISSAESPAIQTAVCRTLTKDDRVKVAEFFFERWDQLSPTALREALALITGNSKSGLALMKRMKSGEISKALMPPMTRWSYGRSTNSEINALANELFGAPSGDRSEVIARYQSALETLPGDADRGRAVFEKATCSVCHEAGGTGVAVGPPLNDVKLKPAAALLSDILDPNRAIEERWISVTVVSNDGRILTGLVSAEDSSSVTLTLPGGIEETIIREDIAEMKSPGYSLMPEGLEAAISPGEMADLVTFLKNG